MVVPGFDLRGRELCQREDVENVLKDEVKVTFSVFGPYFYKKNMLKINRERSERGNN